MSYEFFAKTANSHEVVLARVLEAAELQRQISVLQASSDQATLCWIADSIRGTWPEDITLYRTGDGLIVEFHTGTQTQRNEFLLQFSKQLSKEFGIDLNFEET